MTNIMSEELLCLDAVAHGGNPQDRAASLNKNLPISPSPYLPTLPSIMVIQPDLI
ncbi:hypothetical protein [Moorena sp. SIO3H5]|uniref:hypothetical protein n=1 Tax=Moorena sp. SIO3H5 TaxID=2607834 RepID=UPI0013BBC536|nr:hypothetical protein [Moorena sp. SIO3H5]NEO70147.1 hypothetical protein [Moorena sp. SIO3H5]